jgi:hypothetical protein
MLAYQKSSKNDSNGTIKEEIGAIIHHPHDTLDGSGYPDGPGRAAVQMYSCTVVVSRVDLGW